MFLLSVGLLGVREMESSERLMLNSTPTEVEEVVEEVEDSDSTSSYIQSSDIISESSIINKLDGRITLSYLVYWQGRQEC